MTKQQEAAIARVCGRECLQRELVEALQEIVDRFGPAQSGYIFSKRSALQRARAVLARAKEQQ